MVGDNIMPSQEIQERILREIKTEISDPKMRDFLKRLLDYEISISYQGKPNFSSRYEQIIESVLSKWPGAELKMKDVRLKSLEMQNYRQFVNQKIDLTTSAERNIIVIIG